MRGRGWIKDFISHFILILIFATGLYFVWKRVADTPDLADLVWLRWLLYLSAGVLAVLFIVFINSIFSNYYLERFDPVKPDSLKRLEKIRRFHLSKAEADKLRQWEEPIVQMSHILAGRGYEETARWRHGIVYTRTRLRKASGRRPMVDQFFLSYKPIMNVLIVDGVIRDCMTTITRTKKRRTASRNYLLFITDSQDKSELTSAAAGVVNYLGKIAEGSLSPMLLDTQFGRLFYPLDRSLIRIHHRWLQDALRRFLKTRIREDRPLARGERFSEPEVLSAEEAGVRPVTLSLPPIDPDGLDLADAPATEELEDDVSTDENDHAVDISELEAIEEDRVTPMPDLEKTATGQFRKATLDLKVERKHDDDTLTS